MKEKYQNTPHQKKTAPVEEESLPPSPPPEKGVPAKGKTPSQKKTEEKGPTEEQKKRDKDVLEDPENSPFKTPPEDYGGSRFGGSRRISPEIDGFW